MDERRPPGLEMLSRSLRQVAPPQGMKRRVLDRIERRSIRPRRRARWRLALIFIPATAVAAGAVHRVAERPMNDGAREQASIPRRTVRQPSRARRLPPPPPPLQLPAMKPLTPKEATGQPEAPRRTARPRPDRKRAPALPPDELALQVAAYERALTLQERAPRQALLRFRRMRRRWPHGPLAHEVMLRIIETRLRTADHQEARQEARRFLAQFPNSPRAAEIRALVQKK